jgi:bacteriorhodopsin
MFWRLLLGTVIMLVFGYAGEANQAAFALPGFIGGMLGWFFILWEIFGGEASKGANGCSDAVKKSYQNMRWIVSVGWSIYPLGYVLGTLTRGASAELLNLVYNLADFVNKIGFVLSCWSAAKEDAAKETLLA